MKRTQILLLCFIMVWSCIPIVDKIAPSIQDFNNLSLTYRVQDTIRLFLTYRDNDRLDSVSISIRRQVPPSGNPWVYFSKRAIRGRRFEDTIRIPIRRDAPLGIYDLDVRVKDFAKLSSVPLDTVFELLGDNRAPVISRFSILSTGVGSIPQTDLQGRFVTCRSSVIRMGGFVTDNIRVREVRATLSDITANPAVTLISTSRSNATGRDTVNLLGLFDNEIRIPNTTANGRILQLAISAVDLDGNQSTPIRTNFIVNCDDQPPAFALRQTSPAFITRGDVNEVSLIEGSTFRVLDATASDESGLGSIAVSFNELNQPRNIVFQRNFAGTITRLRIDSLLATTPNLFQLPANAAPGAIYEIIFTIRDRSGNEAVTPPPLRFLITVIRDEPPIFSPPTLITYIDSKEVRLIPSLSATNININQIARGQTLQIEGKIEEDRALEYIRVFWGPTGQETQLVDLKTADITLPFDFASLAARTGRAGNTFAVPDTRVGSSYSLIIRAKDLKNPEIVLRYVFNIN